MYERVGEGEKSKYHKDGQLFRREHCAPATCEGQQGEILERERRQKRSWDRDTPSNGTDIVFRPSLVHRDEKEVVRLDVLSVVGRRQ